MASITSEADFDESQVLFRLPADAAAESVGVAFDLAAGSYQIIWPIEGHFAAGMKGTLTVGSG